MKGIFAKITAFFMSIIAFFTGLFTWQKQPAAPEPVTTTAAAVTTQPETTTAPATEPETTAAPVYTDYFTPGTFPLIAAEAQQAGTIRIMSYNIRCADVNGTPAKDRLDIGVRQILEVMPDSLGLQEVTSTWMRALDAGLEDYAWVGLDRDKGGSPFEGGEACPVFYLKDKFTLLDSGNFWLSETPDVPSYGPGAACRRICTWVKLQNRQTGEVYVHVNSHFDHVSEEARVQGGLIVNQFIADHFTDVPVVFTADMNTQPDSETYLTMTGNLADARLTAADAVGYGTFHDCRPETHANYIIDYVLCSAPFGVQTYRVVTTGIDGRFTSDHFPLYADLVLPAVD